MSDYSYINDYYKVPACSGRRVRFTGSKEPVEGVIVGTNGLYVKIHLDGESKPSGFYHPTWELEYLGMGEIPKMSRSAARYQRFIELDGSMTFREFLLTEKHRKSEFWSGRQPSVPVFNPFGQACHAG